jgi:hypothetical protein
MTSSATLGERIRVYEPAARSSVESARPPRPRKPTLPSVQMRIQEIRYGQGDAHLVEELRWWANNWVDGDAGRRGIDYERFGAPAGDRGYRFYEIGERATRATARHRRIQKTLDERCTAEEQFVLAKALQTNPFKVHARDKALERYGDFPGALWASELTFAEFKKTMKEAKEVPHLSKLGGWLRRKAHDAATTKPAIRDPALRLVERLRRAAEAKVRRALLAYGVELEGVRVPRFVSLRELARRSGYDHHTIRAECEERGIALRPGRRGQPMTVRVRELRSRWPEAVRLLWSAEQDA